MSNGKNNQLPADRVKTVEAGLAFFQQVQHERDELQDDMRAANESLAKLRVEIDGLHHQIGMLESSIARYQAERDQAIAERAEYIVFLGLLKKQINSFKLPMTAQTLNIEEHEDDAIAREAPAE